MLLMQLGEVIFGGVGCGLYGMLAFAILTVFIAGLMVGRTPEFLGKKIEPYEMKWSVVVCLATPVAILLGSGIAAIVPGVADRSCRTKNTSTERRAKQRRDRYRLNVRTRDRASDCKCKFSIYRRSEK